MNNIRTKQISFLHLLMVVLCVMSFSFTLLAQGKKKSTSSEPKETEYDFEEDLIEGNTKSPEELYINSLKNSKLSNLITIREDFKKEIVKSAEGI